MSERTDTKLRETKFFFQNLVRESDKESPSEPEAFLFYLNAFLTAGESVRCSIIDLVISKSLLQRTAGPYIWVISGHRQADQGDLLYPQERTCSGVATLVALGNT
jgi:hypothetical protein